MYFHSFAELMDMGGHGVFVWGAYALTVVVLMFNVIYPIMSRRRFFRAQKQLLRREEARDSE
jgi:heme exporter protein D